MATVATNNLTLLDHARRLDPDGKIARIIEMMSQVNEVMEDLVVVEGNTQTGHKTTIRTGIPTPTWRQINKGVQPSKSTTRQIEFTAGRLEAFGQVDEALVELASDPAGFRLSENFPHIEGMSQQLASTLFYGDVTVNPERFTGLAPYYSDPSAENGGQLINGGGSSTDNNTSLWLVVWGENSICGFYPKNTKAGIEHNDLGKQLVEDGITTGSKFLAWVDQYIHRLGMAMRDYRYAVRICNLDVSDLATAGASSDSSANLIRHMVQAMNKIWSLKMGRAAWYCNKTVKTALDIQAINKVSSQLTFDTLQNGQPITKFMGIPIRRVDAILDTEAAISFS
jgi:hypothetical protein